MSQVRSERVESGSRAGAEAVSLTVQELMDLLTRNKDIFVVDVRNEEEFDSWRLEGRDGPVPTVNKPYVELLEEGGRDDMVESVMAYAAANWAETLPRDRLIIAVCAKGGTSDFVTDGLRRLGYRAVNLEGGMVAWGNYYRFLPIVEGDDFSIYQVIRPARGCLSYVAASRGQAVVIDPLRHFERYAEFIEAKGWRAAAVLDTHAHADHISGGPALAERLEVPYYLHAYDAIHPLDVLPATLSYEPVTDGQRISFGQSTLQALHIPGHTLGNLAYLLDDRYVLTGDSIFIQSVARPDLGGRGDAWAPLHYRSLQKLLSLPDSTLVLPGHFSRLNEANERGTFARTLGELRMTNHDLQVVGHGEEAFVKHLLGHLPTFPPQYVDIKRVNAGFFKPDEDEASELELGRNICALAHAYEAGKGEDN